MRVPTVLNAALLLTFALEAAALSPPPGPIVTGVAPAVLSPRGGNLLTIRGSSFQAPLRVFLEPADGGGSKEAFVISVTLAEAVVVVPAFEVPAHGAREAGITVVSKAGTANEMRVSVAKAVRFEAPDLAPRILVVSPSAGSREGHTRITLFGEGFQAPAQLFAVHADGSESEMQLIQVRYDTIVALTPPAAEDELVGVRVANVLNGQSYTLENAFRYVAPMSVDTVTPSAGPSSGGTHVAIDGVGFSEPMAVIIGGVPARVVQVTDRQIVAVTGELPDPQCSDHAGRVEVVNVDTGASADGAPFTYLTSRSEFRFVPSQAVVGKALTVMVIGASDSEQLRFELDHTPLAVDGMTNNGDGSTSYRLRLPEDLPFGALGCRQLPFAATLRVINPVTNCRDTRPLVVRPSQNGEPCRQPRQGS